MHSVAEWKKRHKEFEFLLFFWYQYSCHGLNHSLSADA